MHEDALAAEGSGEVRQASCSLEGKEAVLFDLGNTLVRYFQRSEFPTVLEEAILGVRRLLGESGLLEVAAETMWRRVAQENHEAEDHRVRPLAGRLARIFQLAPGTAAGVADALCRCFTEPLLARGHLCEDAIPVLQQIRAAGIQTGLVSNTPWGSPGNLWRADLDRLGLGAWLDVTVFCTDVGWRKPARPIFEQALAQLGVAPRQCLFVGDDPRWDLAGPQQMGMEAVLIDRQGTVPATAGGAIRDLYGLWDRLKV
jgi:putative hydrolase of the HAD superfamily